MDQLKIVMAGLKKHHFWVLCGLSVVIGLTVWSLATADLATRIEARERTLEGHFQKMTQIFGTQDHPNQQVIDGCTALKEVVAKEAYRAWKTLFEKQTSSNLLPEDMSEEFKIHFHALRGPEDEIPSPYRDEYMDFIRDHFPKLFEDLKVIQTSDSGQPVPDRFNPRGNFHDEGDDEFDFSDGDDEGNTRAFAAPQIGRPRGADVEEEPDGVVVWNEADRNRILDPFYFPSQPTTSRILLAQEDLWVYEALMRVIKRTNGPVEHHRDAAIKEIVTMEIGQDVVGSGENASGVGMLLAGGSPKASRSSTTGESANIVSSRYVDEQGLPLKKTPAYPFYDHPCAEFKMMPIRMRLWIEPSKIPRLLVECANSTMPIEVRRFRLRPGEGKFVNFVSLGATAESATAKRGTRTGEGAGSKPEFKRSFGSSTDVSAVPIVMEGIICIYNRPDRQKLGTGAAGEEEPPQTAAASPDAAPAADGATEATAPATAGQPPGPGG